MIPRRQIILTNWLCDVKILAMATEKAMTVRLSREQAEALETVATVEDLPVSKVIRAAIAEHIDRVRRDPAFQDSLRERIDRAQKLLSR